jgi:tetratricopeptide (TPR) repeat protein
MNAERKQLTISQIKSHFDTLSKQYGFIINPKAGVLFDMAMDLKNEKKFYESIEMFKFLIGLYTDSEAYFYYLGQTYQQKGEILLAKENFIKSLKINPNYVRAKTALENIK